MNNTIRLLLAEDEPVLGQILKESLETRDFIVSLVTNGALAVEQLVHNSYDIIVLDVMMPEMDGFTAAKIIREQQQDIPIIFLTAKSQVDDVLEGFHAGGNDYIKKPFSIEELIVRIHNATQRHAQRNTTANYQMGDYHFDFPKQQLTYQQQPPIQLTHREAQLLYHLYQKKNQVLERGYILNKLWGSDDFFTGRSMDVFITKLRKKLALDDHIQIINVRGYGYKLIVP